MTRPPPFQAAPLWVRIGLGIACALLAWLLRIPLEPLFADGYPFITFFPAVAIVAFLLGLWPSLACCLVSTVIATRAIPLLLHGGSISPAQVTADLIFIGSGVVVSILGAQAARTKRSEAALRQAESRLSAIIEYSPSCIFAKDRDGRYLIANSALARLVGVPPKAFIGRTDEEFFGPDAAAAFAKDDARVLQSGQPRLSEESFDFRGNTLTALTTKFPLLDGAGNPYAVCGIATDVTDLKRAEAALRESEERFRNIFHHTTVGMAQIDVSGRFLLVNARFCEITGRTPEQLGQTTCAEITHPEDQASDQMTFRQALHDRQPFIIEKRYLRPDGSPVWVRNSVCQMHDEHGRIKYLLAASIDTTASKLAEQARQQFVALAETSADFVGMCDLQFRPFYLNAAGLRMVGLESLDDARNVSVKDWFYPEDQAFLAGEFFPRVLREGRGEVEIRFRHFKSTQPLWVIYSVVLLKDEAGNPTGFATISRNITDRKAAEENLRRSVQELERFVSIASHDLKEPLRGVATLAQFVREDDAAALSPQSAARLTRIDQLCRRLIEMVNSLLDYAKSGGDRLHVPCDLEQLARRAVDKLSESFLTETVEVSITGPLPRINGDPDLLERALGNLIVNALRHNSSPVKTVEIGSEGGAVFIRDNGIGIEPKHHDRIFQMFKRIPGTTHDGVGAGLALVKAIIESHGGSIRVRSQLGSGSTFLLHFPAAHWPNGDHPRHPRHVVLSTCRGRPTVNT